MYLPPVRNNFTVKTVITDSAEEAAEFIRRGGIVAFPTETVYGLGADIFNEEALAKIFEAKRRPADNPLIVHIADRGQIRPLATSLSDDARMLIEKFFPGPLTVVVEKSPAVPRLATAGLDSVGIRMPRGRLTGEFLAACGTPVAAPSANISGRPSPTTWKAVREDLDGRIDCILQGDSTEIGLESTVVDCTGNIPALLRPGAISIDLLRAVVPGIGVAVGGEGDVVHSPGMRHQHYSPKARVRLVDAGERVDVESKAAYIGIYDVGEGFELKRLCGSAEEYAREVFEFFRECDRAEIETIYCEVVQEDGIGVALMDRLRRASEKVKK